VPSCPSLNGRRFLRAGSDADIMFQGQIARGGQGDQDRHTGYRVDEIIKAAWRSANEDRPLTIDWKA